MIADLITYLVEISILIILGIAFFLMIEYMIYLCIRRFRDLKKILKHKEIPAKKIWKGDID